MAKSKLTDIVKAKILDAVKRGAFINTSCNPKKRLSDLQTGHYEELQLLTVIEGEGLTTEKVLHKRFNKYHIRGEWFHACDEILNYIQFLKDKEEKADYLPLFEVKNG